VRCFGKPDGHHANASAPTWQHNRCELRCPAGQGRWVRRSALFHTAGRLAAVSRLGTGRGYSRFRAPTSVHVRPLTLARHDERATDRHLGPAMSMDGFQVREGEGRGVIARIGPGSNWPLAHLLTPVHGKRPDLSDPRFENPSTRGHGVAPGTGGYAARPEERLPPDPVSRGPAADPPVPGSSRRKPHFSSPWAGTGKQAPLNCVYPESPCSPPALPGELRERASVGRAVGTPDLDLIRTAVPSRMRYRLCHERRPLQAVWRT
jgi:hypothetical protein